MPRRSWFDTESSSSDEEDLAARRADRIRREQVAARAWEAYRTALRGDDVDPWLVHTINSVPLHA